MQPAAGRAPLAEADDVVAVDAGEGASSEDLPEDDGELLEGDRSLGSEAAGRTAGCKSLVHASRPANERQLDGFAADRVEVGGRRTVALDELRCGSLGVHGDLRLVRRQREVGIPEPRREVVERRPGMPGDRGERLVATPELREWLFVAVEE
jgi:hypothetical protein